MVFCTITAAGAGVQTRCGRAVRAGFAPVKATACRLVKPVQTIGYCARIRGLQWQRAVTCCGLTCCSLLCRMGVQLMRQSRNGQSRRKAHLQEKKSKACRYAGFCEPHGLPRALDRHSSGPRVAPRLGAAYPPASAEPRNSWPTWHCCAQRLPVSPAPKRLVSVALILALYALRRFRRAAVSCCAVLCSPDVPPVRGFPPCTSGGLAGFTGVYCRSSCQPVRQVADIG